MAKYNIYAVAYGIDPNKQEPVFNLKLKTWDECKPYVAGVPGAKYKGFLTSSEADAWLKQVMVDITEHSTPKPSRDWEDKAEQIYNSKNHPTDKEFTSICKKLRLNQVDAEHIIKEIFVNTIKYLDRNGCFDKEEE